MSEDQTEAPAETEGFDSEQSYDERDHVIVRKKGPIAWVIFNNPDRLNATELDTGLAIRRAFDDISEDDAIKVVIFRGEGRAFCSGGNVGWLGTQYFQEGQEGQRKPSQRRRLGHDERHSRDSDAILQCTKVVIAEGKGYVLGVGLDWFLAADILICSEGTVLGHPPARMIAATGNTLYWMLRMGPALHAEMTLMGRYIKAEEAHTRGLVNRVVPLDQLEDTVMAAAEAVCNLPADGLAIGKFNRKVAYEMLGVRASQLQTAMSHSLQVQQRLEPGEWHLVKEREKHGVKGAFKRREERFRGALQRFNPDSP